MLALLSCNGGVVTSGDGPATRLLVATLHGVHIFEREIGSEWTLVGRGLSEFHISAIMFEPVSGLVFAGGHYDAGLWVSEDMGISWNPCNEGLESGHIYTLAVQQRDEGTVLWCGTEPPMLYKSLDLGRSWTALPGMLKVKNTDKWTFPPPPHVAHVKNIAFHPARPDDIFICIEQGALLKSEDAGESWGEVTGYESNEDFFYNDNHRVVFKPSDPDYFWMDGGEGLYSTADGGKNWTHLTTRDDRIGYPDAMFIDPRNESALFMGGPQNPPRLWRGQETPMADPTVLFSDDDGKSWKPRDNGLPRNIVGNIEGMGLHHHGDNVSLFAGTATGEVYYSDDAGANWSEIAERLPPISKGGHYRWFLTDERREEIEVELRALKK